MKSIRVLRIAAFALTMAGCIDHNALRPRVQQELTCNDFRSTALDSGPMRADLQQVDGCGPTQVYGWHDGQWTSPRASAHALFACSGELTMSLRPREEDPRRYKTGLGPVLVEGCGLSTMYVLMKEGWTAIGSAKEWMGLDKNGAATKHIDDLAATYEKAHDACEVRDMMEVGVALALSRAKRADLLSTNVQRLGRPLNAELRGEYSGPRFYATPAVHKVLGSHQQREIEALIPDLVACKDWTSIVDLLVGPGRPHKREHWPLDYYSVRTTSGGTHTSATDVTAQTLNAAKVYAHALLVRASDEALGSRNLLDAKVVDWVAATGAPEYSRGMHGADRFFDRWFGNDEAACAQLHRATKVVGGDEYSRALVNRFAVARRCKGADNIAAALLGSQQVNVRETSCISLRHSDNAQHLQNRRDVAKNDPDRRVRRRCGAR